MPFRPFVSLSRSVRTAAAALSHAYGHIEKIEVSRQPDLFRGSLHNHYQTVKTLDRSNLPETRHGKMIDNLSRVNGIRGQNVGATEVLFDLQRFSRRI